MSSCTWTIAADEGHQIVLNITDFNLEQQEDCHADYVEIRNGGSESSPLIRRLCGSHEPLQIKSHFNRLFLRFVSDRFRHGTGFSANYFTTATGCNGIMRAPFGAITSPNYPSPYAHNTECYWHIHAASGSFIQATFVDFDLENSIGCKYDYVSIFDGPTSHFPPLDTLCGTINPQKSIPTTSNEMLIKFRSDLSSHGRGFHLTYQSICQRRILKQRSGVIESPGFPENYPSNSRCDYQIQVPRGNKINITFSHFGMPEGGTCLSDYLSVYDGDSNSSRRIGMYCGSTPPLPFQSTGNQVFIEFVSDSTTSGSGFRLEWTTWGCGGDILVDRRDNAVARYITSPKYPSPYPPNTVCEWKLISSEYGYGIKLDLMDIDLEQHPTCRWDKLEVFNGPDDKSQPITTLCHTQNVSKTLSSTGQYLFVRFNSDQSKAGNGFKLQYSVVPSICGGNFSIPKSSIQSSQYPQQYEKNLTCGWLITVAEQHVVVLNITALDTDMDPSCESEYLAAYDGDSTSGETLLKECGPQRVTGSTAGGGMVVRSTSNQMFLEFRSNDVQDHNAIGFRAEYTTGCGAVLIASDTPEVFISPNFPSRYAKSLNCSYIIQSEEPNTKVFLQFSFMDIEERNNCTTADYLQIRNGNNPDAPLIGNYCGRKIPPAIISSGNALYIRFTSNDWKEEAGWSATYSNTLSSCGGELRALEGHFVSPNYPSNYVNNAECVWVIKASPGNTIDLNFQNFNLGNKAEDPYCNSDYVEVREESASGIVLGRFCGADVPDNMTSGVGTLWVMFRSSDSDTHPGFLAEYKLRHGGEITGKTSGQIASPLYPMNYPHNASFTWRVTTISGFTIKVKWLRMDMEDRRCYFDYLALYNGPSPVYPLIGKYCGYEIPEPIQTTSNQLFIVMNTDRYGGNGQGFLMEWEAVAPLSAADRTTSVGANQFTFDLKATKNVQKIISPGYPINVMPNQTYDWKLRTDETSHIELTIHDMNFGRRNDSFCSTDKPWLQVVEGTSYRNGKTITNLCNITDKPRYFKATTNNMRLTFLAGPNPDPAATGFNASFQAVCGASIQGSSGQITSENFRTSDVAVVDQNGMNIECVWNVSTDFGQTFEITFDEFELTPSPNCSQHSLTILNGFVGESSVLSPPIGRFCGSTLPRTVPQTRSNRFQVRYYKDPSVTVPTRGFSLKYRLTRYPCGGELRLTDFDRTGIFTTPNFPENYPTNIECEWIIVAPGGDRIRLDFIEKFEMERPNNNACPWDYVEVRDGATTDAALIGHYCGTNRPGTLRSRSNVMYVKFRSDRGLVHSGFKANYSISTCGGTIVDSSGSITNPSYPQSYPVSGSFDCEWYIQVPVGHFINFEVRDFKLPIWSLNCTFGDFVEFREYNATGKVIKRLCGTQAAMTFSSSDSLVYVRFKTSTSPPQPTGGLTPETANKFRVLFVANTESCGGTLTTSSGIITSPGFPNAYPNNRVCVWKIIATPGRRVLLEVLDFDVEGYGFCQSDFVEVYNGILPDSPRIERLCGSRQAISTKISSSMHYMTVRFQTDSSRTSRGFRLRYSSLEAAKCGGALTSLSGVISSPNFNSSVKFGGYEANEECIWTINNLPIAGDPSTINLDDDCRSDFVEVRAGKESTDPLVQTVCGRRSDYTEESLMIPGQTAWIRFRSDYSHQLSGFRIVYNISNCGGVVNQLAGWILSPGYSDYASTEYPPNLNCAWLIQTPTGGGQIQFTLRDLQLESSLNCSKDSLEILNGRYHTSPKIGETLCGTQAISPIRSQGSSMYVKFRSDSAGSARGFKASYMTVTNGCGGTYHGNTGYIATPGFIDNDNYPENMECVWDIIVDIGYHINFTFSGRFDIQKSDDCNDDYVELSDRAADPRNPQILGRYCGHDTPNATLSSSNRMRIRFRSNAAATAKGFNATWTIGCGGRLTDGEGTIVSPGFPGKPDNNLMCRWEIVANPATPNIKLEFDPDHFDIEGSRRLMLKEAGRANLMGYQLEVMCHDYLIVYGERTDNESQAISNPPRLCGSGSTDIPQPIYAQNKMTIFFATDFALAGNGFKLTYKTQTAPFYADAQRVTPSVVPVGRLFRWSGG
ncbi:Cubilin [Hypsibius exemplaris]|uniref:Cubilin n=1 Tax=Hypsibius exemplaris TaxID=2072580 RepID=A0A1W0WY34_HYPEX|nr:Cubilin [Hypsibius exemplaris]